jgi:prephenate dehydratase
VLSQIAKSWKVIVSNYMLRINVLSLLKQKIKKSEASFTRFVVAEDSPPVRCHHCDFVALPLPS